MTLAVGAKRPSYPTRRVWLHRLGLASTRKVRTMLGYLALQTGHARSREKLAALLLGGTGEENAQASLRQGLKSPIVFVIGH